MVMLLCQLCGNGFEAKRSDAKFCNVCKPIKHREYAQKTDLKRKYSGVCEVCGNPVTRTGKRGKTHKRCSKCRFLGDRNPAWNGGRHKSVNGYIYLYAPDHPKANNGRYVAEHQLVWEKEHGQLLPEGYIIHHLNGIKDDNRPENLIAIQPKDHTKGTIRELLQARIRDLESQLQAPTS